MIINKRIMSYLNEASALEILKKGTYDSYLTSKYNRSNLSYVTSCKSLAIFDAFENNIAYLLLNEPNKLDRNLMAKYRDYLFSIFTKEPNIIFESLMFNKEIDSLLFTSSQLAEIEKYKHNTTLRCKDIYEKIKKGQTTTNEESTLFLIS